MDWPSVVLILDKKRSSLPECGAPYGDWTKQVAENPYAEAAEIVEGLEKTVM